jgi:hypothetical protein
VLRESTGIEWENGCWPGIATSPLLKIGLIQHVAMLKKMAYTTGM